MFYLGEQTALSAGSTFFLRDARTGNVSTPQQNNDRERINECARVEVDYYCPSSLSFSRLNGERQGERIRF